VNRAGRVEGVEDVGHGHRMVGDLEVIALIKRTLVLDGDVGDGGAGQERAGTLRMEASISITEMIEAIQPEAAVCSPPLERLRPAQQDRLAETLLAWLQRGCNANEVTVSVHVHP
jgi:hypothetical protein